MRTPTLLVVDDEPDIVDIEADVLSSAGYSVLQATSIAAALELLQNNFVDLLILDERIGSASGIQLLVKCRALYPGLGGLLVTGHADLDLSVRAMRAGAIDLLSKPIDKPQLLEAVSRALKDSELTREARFQRWEGVTRDALTTIVGATQALQAAKNLARAAAPTDASVLIQGESGTGKELFARAIHVLSARRHNRFQALNVAAIPKDLGESALFGHRKGSFTGALADQPGVFEAANGGTLFLDEIADASPALQAGLLRALQEREIVRIGETVARKVDVRVVAATNRDLSSLIAAGQFREDLYYRIAVITILLPPLRLRIPDIAGLAHTFAAAYAAKIRKPVSGFTPEAMARLEGYPWPGNVRELENAVHRAVILTPSGPITPAVLALGAISHETTRLIELLEGGYRQSKEKFDRLYFTRLLDLAQQDRSRAAEMAEIDRTTLYDHLSRLGFAKKAERKPQNPHPA
jgi:DNA-binding NtrC family response regulator